MICFWLPAEISYSVSVCGEEQLNFLGLTLCLDDCEQWIYQYENRLEKNDIMPF